MTDTTVTRATDQIKPKQFRDSEGVEDWRLTCDGACAYFTTKSLAESAAFVQAISKLPGIEDHQPSIDVRRGGVNVSLVTYTDDYFGMGTKDVEFARQISAAARRIGLSPDVSKIQALLVIPGAPDIAKVTPFWQAILGYEPRRDSPREDLVDPRGRGTPFWFEQMKEPRGDGLGAIHMCVWLPYEEAKSRIDAALAAGGRMVREQFAPAWWTLADDAGNECDIATINARD